MTSPSLRTLTPTPASIELRPGHWAPPRAAPLVVACPETVWPALRLALGPGAARAGLALAQGAAPGSTAPGSLYVEVHDLPDGPEAYSLEVTPAGTRLTGTEAGVRYGARTLGQMLRSAAREPGPLRLACARVQDRPAFATRGLMLDISRDAVPTMDELRSRIELAAELKYNHLQLYTEHTFAYAGHESVWADSSPLTPAEITELDAYAGERGIELCPNQNSFGHMHRWLTRPAYRHLAEAPEGIVHAFAPGPEPFGLCATDPRSLALLEDLYDQLLPCFRSRRFNVGLDETLDLGHDRSAQACAERGKHEVYLDYLLEVHRRVEDRGRQMLYWADIALEYDEVLSRLPAGATPIVWGYEAGHPFEDQLGRLRAAGQTPWVCPGTSSWQGFTGRISNARANLEQAASAARAHDVEGYLVSDWGDYGHWQPHAVSLPGIVLGAQQAWGPSNTSHPDSTSQLAAILDHHVLDDPAGRSGAALVALGEAYLELGSAAVNGVATFFHLRYIHDPLPIERAAGLTVEGTRRFEEALGAAQRRMAGAAPRGQGAGWITEEVHWAAEASAWAARLAASRLEVGPGSLAGQVPPAEVRVLTDDLSPLMDRYSALWRQRRRPGGLRDSLAKLGRVANHLRGAS